MENVITRIEVDLYSPTSYEVIKAQQGDSLSRIIEIVLLNKGEPYAIPTKNVSIRLEGHRGDGSSFSKSNNCALNNNVITVVLDNDILFYSGTVEVKVVLYELPDDGTKRILSSIPFRVHAQKNPCDKSSITMGNKSLIDDIIFDFTNLEVSIKKNIADEIDRATKAENDLDVKKVDKTTVATSSTLGLVKSGTDITVDSSGNVSVKDNSHKHTVSNISDLTATASELNVLDGITSTTTELNKLHGTTATVDDFNKLHDVTASASELNIMDGVTATTTELNYVDGVTSNIQTQLNAKAPLASPTLTGTPKAPTASAGTNTTQIATTAFVQTAVSNLVDSAPETLNTLNELSSALGDDPNFATTVATQLGNKVDKVNGKGLSTNDYTTAEKNKLAGIASGANAYSHPNSGVTAGTYRSVTVNAQGHVTGGSNPTLTVAQGGTGKTTAQEACNTFINALSVGTDTPSDADYYVAQYANGGTTNTAFYRRPISALWNYIKSKLATVATSGSYNDLSNKPTIGNGTVTIKQAGTSKGTFTMNQSGNTTIELTDTNTTYNTATQSANGLMSKTDKVKLDGIASGANAYSHPTSSGNKHIPSGGSSGQILRWSADGTAVWGNDNNTTYSNFVKSGSGAKAGLVPAPSTTAGTTKYLREDGTWAVPPDTNTTYTSLKNPYALTIQGNGTTLTNGTYDGSAAKTVNITPSSIGAATSSHTHNYAGSDTPGGSATYALQANKDGAGNVIDATYINKTYMRNYGAGSIAFGNNMFIGIFNGDIICSSDGQEWEVNFEPNLFSLLDNDEILLGITYGNEKFVSFSNKGCSYVSSDNGNTWTKTQTIITV